MGCCLGPLREEDTTFRSRVSGFAVGCAVPKRLSQRVWKIKYKETARWAYRVSAAGCLEQYT